MLYAAGAAHCLVGTIAHSTEPADAAKLPIVGDAETLDFEQLMALRPTVVVVAVDVVQRMRIDRIKAMGIPVYQVHVTRLVGMPDSIRRLGALAGTQAIADREADALNAALEALGARYRTRSPIRVLYQIWDRPIYTIGGRHVITDALQLCGAINIFSDLETAAPAVTREAAVLRDPELILASSPPGAADEWLAEWRRYPAMTAVQERAAHELRGRADRSHGPFRDRGHGKSLRGHRQGENRPRRSQQPLIGTCTGMRTAGILRPARPKESFPGPGRSQS